MLINFPDSIPNNPDIPIWASTTPVEGAMLPDLLQSFLNSLEILQSFSQDISAMFKIPSVLKTTLPIRFHGRYDYLNHAAPVLTPHLAPELDILSLGNDPTLIDEALRFANAYDLSDAEQSVVIGEVAEMLKGDISRRTDWRLWQVDIQQDYTLGLYFVHRQDELNIQSVRMPLPRQMNLSFRILKDDLRPPQHKLYLDICSTREYGRELKIAEWRDGYPLTQVTWYLDSDSITADDVTRPGGFAIASLTQEH